MANNKRAGFLGERRAAEFLTEKGYTIADKNYRTKFGEIDIIARKDGLFAFVEVKFRSSNNFGAPSEAVTQTKMRRIIKSALVYLQAHRIADKTVRFDIIEISGKIMAVNHIENAFSMENLGGL